MKYVLMLLVSVAALSSLANTKDRSGERLAQSFMDGMHAGDLDMVGSTLCSDLRYRLNGVWLTKEELMGHIEAAYSQFPDFYHHIEELLSVEDKVILRARDTATDPKTGNELVGGQISVYAIAGGCIREGWEEFTWWTPPES